MADVKEDQLCELIKKLGPSDRLVIGLHADNKSLYLCMQDGVRKDDDGNPAYIADTHLPLACATDASVLSVLTELFGKLR